MLSQESTSNSEDDAGGTSGETSTLKAESPGRQPVDSDTSSSSRAANYVRLCLRILICGVLFLTVIAEFVPFFPSMPASGFDTSWQFAMNQALAQGLVFGKQIVFTYGPYASMSTRMYHPATYHLMTYGGLFVAICYGTALLLLARGARLIWMLLFGALIASFMYTDPLFLSYPLILAGVVYRFMEDPERLRERTAFRVALAVCALLFSVFGLLPLVKGSYIPACVAIALLCFVAFWLRGLRTLAYCSILSPIAGAVVFWLIAGQPIGALPVYVWRMQPIISGYSEAMSIMGDTRQVWLYLLASAGILWMVGTATARGRFDRPFLVGAFGIYLFLAFKGGFVRHDGHAMIAAAAIVLAAILAAFLPGVRNAGSVFVLAVLAWALIDASTVASSTRSFFKNITSTYKNTLNGIRHRTTHSRELEAAFHQKIQAIAADARLPHMNGTVDVYSAEQADLIASGNRWNPRPVIQSYSAYTASLAKLNEVHLQGSDAPDHLLFRLEPLDGRLPALEDGISWFAMLQNYRPVKLENGFVYLDKKPQQASVSLAPLATETGELQQVLRLPDSSTPLFAELEIRQTLLGRLVTFLYKPSPLEITVEFGSGEKKTFRMIAEMGQSMFLISPLVESNETFALLLLDKFAPLHRRAKSIRIAPTSGGSIFWRSKFELKLFTLNETMPEMARFASLDKVGDIIATQTMKAATVACDGGIDEVNGSVPHQTGAESNKVLSANGWLAVSGKDGMVPEDIYVTLTDAQGKTTFLKTHRSQRQDVKAYFKHPDMPDLGFEITAEVSSLKGNYQLGLARIYRGQLGRCMVPNIPIVMTGGSGQRN